MIFRETAILGTWIIDPEPHTDARGAFARTFDLDAFSARGLVAHFDQDSFARNDRAGTVRGLHYQCAPHAETKLVICVSGALFDTVLDLRPGPTFGRHMSVELSAATWRGMYVPAGCAHGYQSLTDDTTVLYRVAGRYTPAAARGVRWDDPTLGIAWPLDLSEISPRDAAFPMLHELAAASATVTT